MGSLKCYVNEALIKLDMNKKQTNKYIYLSHLALMSALSCAVKIQMGGKYRDCNFSQ